MKRKIILKRGLIFLAAYFIFTLYLFLASERIERLNKIYNEKNTNITTINVRKQLIFMVY